MSEGTLDFATCALPARRGVGEDVVATLECREALVIVVSDGAGGVTGGAEAARLVGDRVTSAVADGLDVLSARAWCELLVMLDHATVAEARAGESTAVVLAVAAHRVVGASVGDSEAWLVTDGRIIDLTERQIRRRLGTGQAAPVGIDHAFEGTLVVASDGLFRYTTPDAITAGLLEATAAECVSVLVTTVRTMRGTLRDDLGICVCRRRT